MYLHLPTMMHQRSAWANCGLTCQAIIELAGASLSVGHVYPDFHAAGANAFFALLNAAPGGYLLLDVAIYGIHEFMIDLAPGGGRSLVNGYAEGYGGLWWCGASQDNPNVGMTPVVEAWGKGQDISQKYQVFTERLRNLLMCGTWGGATPGGTTAVQIWKTLPFLPTDTRVAHWAATNQPIVIKVIQHTLLGAIPAAPLAGYHSPFFTPRTVALEAQRLGRYAPW
jgi:hypothetical protein